jgi:hypothetical protein
MQASTTKACTARQGSNLPWQASIGMADFSQLEQIGLVPYPLSE